MSLNPNKYIRKSYVDTLSVATGLPVYEEGLPKDLDPSPLQYIILHSQSKQPFANAKGCSEWTCNMVVDIYSVNEKGFYHSVKNDDIEDIVLNALDVLTVVGFTVNYTDLVNSTKLPVSTPTITIDRTVLNIEHWLNKA